jgi:hypothetical protein
MNVNITMDSTIAGSMKVALNRGLDKKADYI